MKTNTMPGSPLKINLASGFILCTKLYPMQDFFDVFFFSWYIVNELVVKIGKRSFSFTFNSLNLYPKVVLWMMKRLCNLVGFLTPLHLSFFLFVLVQLLFLTFKMKQFCQIICPSKLKNKFYLLHFFMFFLKNIVC